MKRPGAATAKFDRKARPPGRRCDVGWLRRLREGELDDREVVEALERAHQQQLDLQTIVERLERAQEAQSALSSSG